MQMTEEMFRGRLKALSIADILSFLSKLGRRGLLTVSNSGSTIELYLRAGRVVSAVSTREKDRLVDFLLRWRIITTEQYQEAVRRAAKGVRIGKALVDCGALTPRDLVDVRRGQVRQMVLSLFDWQAGEFQFVEGEEPRDDSIKVDLEIQELVADGIRSARDPRLFAERMSSNRSVFDAVTGDPAGEAQVRLEPQESYILSLLDGERDLGSIVEMAEFPDLEIRRIIFMLLTLGRIKPAAPVVQDAAEDGAEGRFEEILDQFNGMLGHVYQYLMRELGPISSHLLERSLSEQEAAHPVLFKRVKLGGDGTLDGELLQANLAELSEVGKERTLVRGLNELLYSELLVLRKTLGAGHEERVVGELRGGPAGGAPELRENL